MTTCTERDYPILKAIESAEAAGTKTVSTVDLARDLGLKPRAVWTGLVALAGAEPPYITWKQHIGNSDRVIVTAPRLRERGLRATGQWPEDGYTALVAILEARITETTDETERSRLSGFLKALRGVGRDVATDFLSALLRDVSGLR